MERIIKTEMQPDGQMLLYYVDENGSTGQGILATVEGEEVGVGDGETYTIVEQIDESMIQYEVTPQEVVAEADNQGFRDKWTDDETKRALIFYIDNKQTFRSGQTRKKHLWTVACKTMLPHKSPTACETKIRNLKRKFSLIHAERLMTDQTEDCNWQFFDLCHQAFHDDVNVNQVLYTPIGPANESTTNNVSIQSKSNVLTVSATNNKPNADPIVERMLKIYYSCKKAAPKLNERWSKTIFQKIALELGETAEYWHKRFLNFKSHYIKILDMHRKGNLTQIETSWPYLEIFEKIFEDDVDFHKKYGMKTEVQQVEVLEEANILHIPNDVNLVEINVPAEWNMTEKTVLIKYYFDSFAEFQDQTIPDSYLWGEIGRLLDKTPEKCKKKYEELREEHLNEYLMGGYNVNARHPIAILFDNIIYKEVEKVLSDTSRVPKSMEVWSVEQVDEILHFFCDNLELFKDSMCHYVCWAAISKKLSEPIHNCRLQWKDLASLYKSILNDKKENPDMQIDWRYTDLFDRIFDYGTDTKLLGELIDKDFQRGNEEVYQEYEELPVSDDEDYDQVDPRKHRGTMDPKQHKILEYYLKNKDKFPTNQRVKAVMWQELAKEIGLTPEHCAHRFRNLKQVYMAYVQREMNTPEKPILWPYYELCKKVFGYRIVKNRLKNKSENYVSGEWSSKEIKTLIKHFAKQYHINKGIDDKIDWSEVSQELKRSETACRDKFIDLRKSYRQIKTMVNRGRNVPVSWKYYNMFDDIYMKKGVEDGEIHEEMETNGAENSEVELNAEDIFHNDANNDEVNNSEVNHDGVNQEEGNLEQVAEEVKMSVLGQENLVEFEAIPDIGEGNVDAPAEMQTEDENMSLEENGNYDQVEVPLEVLETGLNYYLEHVEEFVHPKYDKEYAWKDLCTHVNESLNMDVNHNVIIATINYIKQAYSDGTKDVHLANVVEKILEKEYYLQVSLEAESMPILDEENDEVLWSDDETEQLLLSYRDNLEKFKNPKYITSYLWQDISKILHKHPMACSRKMTEIRQEYRSMVKEKSENLDSWRFYELCREIYGDGTKTTGPSLILSD